VGRVVAAGKRRDVNSLIDALKDIDQKARWVAARELGKLEAVEAVEPLLRCAELASDETFRSNCLIALEKIGDARAIPRLHAIATGDAPFGVRTLAMRALGVLGDRRAVSLLAAVLTDRELLETYDVSGTHLRIAARPAKRWTAKQIIRLDGIEAIPILRRALPDAGWREQLRLRWLISRLGARVPPPLD
jgi:HEAT repeat protein